MSLLWADAFSSQLMVAMSQHHIAMVQLARFNSRVLHQQHALLNESAESGWDFALEKLQRMLSVKQQQKPSIMKVVLGSSFVRYLALPAHHSVMHTSDKVDFARAAYREVYGNIADTWLIQCDDAAPNQSSITVAVDRSLIESLTKVADEHGIRHISVQPYLMPVFNHTKSTMANGQVYFAVVESARLLFASLINGHWQQIRSFSLEIDWVTQLRNIVQRESMTSQLKSGQVLMVYAPNDKAAALPQLNGWTVQRIGILNRWMPSQAQEKYYAMLEAM